MTNVSVHGHCLIEYYLHPSNRRTTRGGGPDRTALSSEAGEWACELSLGKLYPDLPHIVGEDSLQALCLALSLARQLLTYFIEDGGRILVTGTDSDFPIDAWFSRVGPASAVP